MVSKAGLMVLVLLSMTVLASGCTSDSEFSRNKDRRIDIEQKNRNLEDRLTDGYEENNDRRTDLSQKYKNDRDELTGR